MLETLRRLGITPSFSQPRVSNDNAYADPDYPLNGFAAIVESRPGVLAFTRWYNTGHKHSGLKFTTPPPRRGNIFIIIKLM